MMPANGCTVRPDGHAIREHTISPEVGRRRSTCRYRRTRCRRPRRRATVALDLHSALRRITAQEPGRPREHHGLEPPDRRQDSNGPVTSFEHDTSGTAAQ